MGTGKREKTRGYPALSSLRKRRKSRDYVDYDYLHKLTPEQKEYLNQFTDEFYNGNGYKFGKPLLDGKEMARKNYAARSDLMNEFQRVDLGVGRLQAGAEDAIIEAIDSYDHPVESIGRSSPGPATSKTSGLPGLGVFARCPAIESVSRPTPQADGLETDKPPYLSPDWSPNVSKTGHQKKRVRAKASAARAKLAAAPTPPTASPAGDMFRQTANLLKCGLFAGANASAVAQAINLMLEAATTADAGPRPVTMQQEVEAPANA